MKNSYPKRYSENHVIAILFNRMSHEKYTVVGGGWYWNDLVFFHHQAVAVYKGNIYSIDPLVAELLLIKMEIRNLRNYGAKSH